MLIVIVVVVALSAVFFLGTLAGAVFGDHRREDRRRRLRSAELGVIQL